MQIQQDYQLAIQHYQNGEIRKARDLIHRILSQNDELLDVHLLDAAISAAQGEFSDVVKKCEKVLELDPGNTRACYNAAVASQKLENYHEVIGYINCVLDVDPTNVPGRLLRLAALYKTKAYEKCIEEAVCVLTENTNTAEVGKYIEKIIHSNNDIYLTKNIYERVLEVSADNVYAIYQLIRLSLDCKDIKAAREYLEKIESLDSTGVFYIAANAAVLSATGDVKSAIDILETSADESTRINPVVSMMLAKLYMQVSDYAKALSIYEKNVSLTINTAECYHNIGSIYDILGDYIKSISAYQSSIIANPESVASLYNLSFVTDKSGNKKKAIGIIDKCWNMSDTIETREAYVRLLSNADVHLIGESTEDFILAVMQDDDIDAQLLSSLVIDLLIERCTYMKGLIEAAVEENNELFAEIMTLNIERICRNNMLQQFYLNMPITSYDVECFSRALRKFLLFNYLANRASNEIAGGITASLAVRCYVSGYILTVSENEREAVMQLINKLPDIDSPAMVQALSVLAMYISLYELSNKYDVLIPVDLTDTDYDLLVIMQYLDNVDEKRISEGIQSISVIDDDISVLVKNQYESNPYPVWQKITKRAPEPLSNIVNSISPYIDSGWCRNVVPDILIAGCGTGSHVIQTAYRMRYSSITAIDLSKRSLAFASRKATEYKLNDINFIQMDINNLKDLGMKFDVIESVGVLHHMQDTLTGLKMLVSCLHEDGLLNIGLYSKIGRRYVIEAKNIYDDPERVITDDAIRSLRLQIMNSGNSDLIHNITGYRDFYSLHECRDLLFHENENNIDINELSTLIEEAGLQFIGFDLHDKSIISKYRKMFPDDHSVSNLENWSLFEQENPDTFSSMYVFWCKKV